MSKNLKSTASKTEREIDYVCVVKVRDFGEDKYAREWERARTECEREGSKNKRRRKRKR